ncbi:uncharacterized protein LOC144652480 isoform X1 [Oculina patagonica]
MDNVAISKGCVDRSTDHGENQDDLEVENAIADDFGSYDCFMQPFYSAEMGDEQTKVMEVECFDQIDNTRPKGNVDDEGNKGTRDSCSEGLPPEGDLDSREKAYHRNFLKLQRMVVEKIKEAEDVTAEKEELERSVQTALQKLWAKEEELHIQRESSFEREKCLIEDLRQESAHSEELEIQVQTLTSQKNMLQEQVFQLEQQLSLVRGETEKRKRELDRKLPELESTQESLKKMTAGLMGQIANHNNRKSRAVDVSPSSTEENSSDLSSSEQYNESGESLEDDLSAEVKMTNLKEQNHNLRKELKCLIAGIEDLWGKVNPHCNVFDVNEKMEEVDSALLLNDILQFFCREKSMVADLEEQNARQLKHLEEIQEAHCLTEGRIRRLWVKFCLHEEKEEEIQTPWTKGIPASTEETDGVLQNIESVLSRNTSTLQESQELKRLIASREKKIEDLKALVGKLREEHKEISKELERKNAILEESRLSTNKTIEDRDVEIEILKEHLQKSEKNEEHLKHDSDTGSKCTDEVLEKLLQSKEHAFDVYRKKYEKEEMAQRDEVKDLREALDRASRDKNDLQEYCELLKEQVENSEMLINTAEEDGRSSKELLEQGKKKEEKLLLTAKELYDEVKTKRQEALSQETTIAVLQEKVNTLELELHTTEQDRQVDKKNLRNAKETEQYLQASLQQALRELFQLKTNGYDGLKEDQTAGVPDEQEHKQGLQERFQQLEALLQTALAKNAQDLEEYAARIADLCEENTMLKKEVDECKRSSCSLQRTNRKFKTLLRAIKDDLVEEIKAKKELEVLLMKSNEKSEPGLRRDNGFDEQSTTSQLQCIDEAGTSGEPFVSASESILQGQKKTGKVKGLAKRKLIPKALSKRFSSSSVNVTSPRREKKDGQITEGSEQQNYIPTTEDDPRSGIRETSKMAQREQRLRNVLMAVQRDKEELEQDVESLNNELQMTKTELQNYVHLKENIREETSRNVRESLEMKKALEAIYGKTRRAHTMINKDIQRLLEVLKEKDKQIRKFEWLSEKVDKENVDLVRTVAALKEKLKDEVTLKEVAIEEGRQLRDSLQNVLEAKEKSLLQSEPPLLINNLNTDLILPQMGKDEVRAILKEVLEEIELSSSEEVSRLKQRTAEQMEELRTIRKDNEYLRNLVDHGVQEELQRAEERISYLNGQLKLSQERQNVLREAAIKDKLKTNEEVEKFFERYAELKFIMKDKEEALERYEEIEEALMSENTHLQEEIDALKERFGVDGLLPEAQKAETKRMLEGWKRKCQRLQENFDKENSHLQEENNWLHKQLLEESSLCEELRRCNEGHEQAVQGAEEKVKEMHRKLEERQEALACLEERRVVLETKLVCLQKVNDDLQNELSKERSEAEQNLMEVKNEFAATAKDLKRHQQEGNNLVTKVFLLENAKEKLEQELKERERKMMISLESFTEERSRLSERVRDLRISLEEEVRRRLDLEEKMQQIVKISVMEKEQDRLKAVEVEESSYLDHDAKGKPRRVYKTEYNSPRQQSLAVKEIPTFAAAFTTETNETTGQPLQTGFTPE